MKKTITIDPARLREECLSFGLCIRVCLDLIPKEEEIDEKVKEGVLFLTTGFLFGQVVDANELIYAAALAYESRRYEISEDNYSDFPAWGEGERTESQKIADSFFSIYALYLAKNEDGDPKDYLGPIQFFSGAINEDIAEGLSKKKGDRHYDAFYIELTSYPFSKIIKETAMKLYNLLHE